MSENGIGSYPNIAAISTRNAAVAALEASLLHDQLRSSSGPALRIMRPGAVQKNEVLYKK
jgi:hypothetical protein